MAPRTKLAVIVHADVVGSTDLVQADERLAHESIRGAFRRFAETINRYGGQARELRGDALVAEFSRSSDAVGAALAFQNERHESRGLLLHDSPLQLRIGIALGEVVVADETVTGAGVVLAQRLEQLAQPGGVCVQSACYETLPKRLPFEFQSLGEQLLKGFAEPMLVYAVSLRPGSAAPEPDSMDQRAHQPIELPDRPSIAVLPFANLSNDPEQEFFADGMADDVIAALSRFRSLFVVARHSTFTYKGKAADVRQVARDLGVRYVLDGSVRKSGDRIRVTAQLVDAAEGNHIWAERYDEEVDDLFALQDKLTERLVSTIAPEIDEAERQRADRKTLNGFDSWLMFQKGLSAYFETTREGLKMAVTIFDDICRRDARFALAHALAGDTRLRQAMHFEHERAAELIGEAKELAHKARVLDSRDAIAFCVEARALSIQGDHDNAVRLANQGVRLNPNLWMAHHTLGFVLIVAGRFEEGLKALDVADRFNPLGAFSAGILSMRSGALLALRRFDEAARIAGQGIDAAHPRPSTFLYLAAAHAHLGRMDQARRAIGELRERHPDYFEPDFQVRRFSTGALPWDAVGETIREGLGLCLSCPE